MEADGLTDRIAIKTALVRPVQPPLIPTILAISIAATRVNESVARYRTMRNRLYV